MYIADEQQLQEARKLLERYGEPIDDLIFILTPGSWFNYLRTYDDGTWGLLTMNTRTQITLTELEQILKEEHESSK